MNRVLFFICFFIMGQILWGQVLNIEKERLEQDTLQALKFKISSKIKIFNRSAGEKDPKKKTEFELDYSSIYEPGKHAYILIAELDFENVNRNGIIEFGFIHGRINWFKDAKFSYETFAQSSYDGTRGLDIRTILGNGVRYEIMNKKLWEMYLATGIMWEHEKWQHPYESQIIRSDILKLTNYISVNWTINGILNLNNVFYYQAGLFQDLWRNRFSNWLILNTKITRKLSLKNELITNFEDKPIVPITKFIYSFETGISYNF